MKKNNPTGNNLTEKVPIKHFLLIMRTTFILLFICVFCSMAEMSYTQNARVTINKRNVSLKEVLNEIERQTDYLFIYSNEVNTNENVSVKSKEQAVANVLNKLLKDKNVDYTMEGNHIILAVKKNEGKEEMESAEVQQQQKKEITGRIVDAAGIPVIGANIVEVGTTNGTVTDVDGNFSLSVEEDANIRISYIGYLDQTIATVGQSSFNITLIEDTRALDEVVVVGYGVQKKVNLTGAVSTVQYDEELGNRPITNASQAISGQMPGIWVSQNSGQPGNDAARIRIRGWGTLNNSSPLIIIDGVEGDLNNINPRDIESISVLKDAASAAIYGSKAANGVVLVTTKSGNRSEKTQVTLSSYFGIQQLGRRYELITNSAEHMKLTNQALLNAGGSPLFPDNLITAFENGTDKYKYPNTDWFDVLFKDAPIQEHNLSITGGTEKSTTFISFNYLNQEGMIPNTKTERYGLRANMGLDVNSWFHLDTRINYNRRISEEPYNDLIYGSLGRIFDMLSGAAPYIAPYTRDGKYGSVEAITDTGIALYDNRNPLIDANNGKKKTEIDFLSLNVNADIKLAEFLHWSTNVSSRGTWNLTDNYNETLVGYSDSGIPMMTKNYNREGLEISRSQYSTLMNNVFSTLNFNKTVNEKHELSAIAGLQLEDMKIKNTYARKSDPPKEGLTQVDAGTSGIQAQGNMNGLRMFSYFGRLNYAFDNKYLFEFNIRADGSSRFKKENRWGIFPGMSVGWRLNEESFMENQDIFSNLKLRASWGELGNQNIADYWPYLTIINQNNNLSYSYNGTFAPGAAVTSLVDDNITWETTSSLDVGLDAGFLDNKVNVEADYFYKKTSDILVQLPIPLMMGGLTAPYENRGEMVNKGFEFILNLGNRQFGRDHFGYNIGLNLTYIDNEVTKFGGNSPDQLYLIREGYSYQTLYGYKAIGIYQSDEEAKEHMFANSYKPIAGNLKFEDLNEDGKLGFEDRQEIGNTIPKFSYGLNASFNYKGFDLNLLFQGLAGVHGYNQNTFTYLNLDTRSITTKWRDAWSPDNKDTDVPILYFNNSWDNQESSYWVKDLNFLKLKNVQLGYDLPQSLTSRTGLEKIYLYLNAQNVFVLVDKDFEGYDPEKDTFTHGINQFPVPRIISFGINLNF